MTDAALAEDTPGFTYSHPGMPRFRRGLIRAVERASGQPMLRNLYLDWAAAPPAGETVFDAAMRLLGIRTDMRWHAPAAAVPREGGLLLVANHPFGIVDGLALGQLGMRLRGNVQIMTNSVLCQPREVSQHLLPIDFSGTAEAKKASAQSRRLASDLLAAGKVVAMFPAGGSPRRMHRCGGEPSMPSGIPSWGVWPCGRVLPCYPCSSTVRTRGPSRSRAI